MALALTFAVADARADVIQIAPDGAVVTYARPTIFAADSATAITPATPAKSDSGKAALAAAMQDAGGRADLSPLLIEAVAWAESRFKVDAQSPAGAIGVMQLMPGTAAELGVDPHDPAANIRGGAHYLRQMLAMFDGDVEKALAAYNAGPGAVRRYNGVPPFKETRAYVSAILEYMAARAHEDTSR